MFSRNLARLLFIFAAALGAQEARSDQSGDGLRLADPAVLEHLQATGHPATPKYLTELERRYLRLPDLSRVPRDPPIADALRTASEYELNQAIIMRWRAGVSENSVLASMVVPITTSNDPAKVMLVVRDGTNDQSNATSTLGAAGADMSRVEFVPVPFASGPPDDSIWIRDYGPRFSSADNLRIIVDHEYNRWFRPNDNQVPAAIAAYLDEDIYEMPLLHGGGNFHLFSNGEAFMTSLILDENTDYTEQDVIDLYADYQGVDLTILDPLPASFDSTQHLDMWFLPVDDQTVIIGDYNIPPPGVPSAPQVVIDVTEDTATMMQGRGYTVLRTPGWRSNAHITYTNSVIVNDLVLICEFNGFNTQNAQALAVYEQAFPDKTIVPVNCSGIIGLAGALHCIVMHKPFKATFEFTLEPQTASTCVPPAGTEEVAIDVEVDMINFYEGGVMLSAGDVPAGVASDLHPDPVFDPGTFDWTLTIGDTAAAGTTEITLTGDDGDEVKSVPFFLTLEAPPAGTDLVFPADATVDVDLQPQFTWQVLDGIDDYRIQIATDAGFGDIVFDGIVAGTDFEPEDELEIGTVYYWRVSGLHHCGDGDWSDAFSFQTRFDPLADLAPGAFAFELQTGQNDSAVLEIGNAGSGELVWSIDTEACAGGTPAAWLSVDPASGSTPAGEPDSVEITVDTTGVSPGTHEGALCVTTNEFGVDPVTVPVLLEVLDLPPGSLAVDPLALDFGEVVIGDSAIINVTVSNLAAAGSAALELTQLAIISGQSAFAIGEGGICEQGMMLAPQESCTAEVIFSPVGVTAYAGALRVGAETGQPITVSLTGHGTELGPVIFDDRFEEN